MCGSASAGDTPRVLLVPFQPRCRATFWHLHTCEWVSLSRCSWYVFTVPFLLFFDMTDSRIPVVQASPPRGLFLATQNLDIARLVCPVTLLILARYSYCLRFYAQMCLQLGELMVKSTVRMQDIRIMFHWCVTFLACNDWHRGVSDTSARVKSPCPSFSGAWLVCPVRLLTV